MTSLLNKTSWNRPTNKCGLFGVGSKDYVTALIQCTNMPPTKSPWISEPSRPAKLFIYLQIIFLSMPVYLSQPGGCLHYNVQSGSCQSGRGLSHSVTLSVTLSPLLVLHSHISQSLLVLQYYFKSVHSYKALSLIPSINCRWYLEGCQL